MKPDPKLKELEAVMDKAADYAEWHGAAASHDELSGALEWIGEHDTPDCDWKLLQARTQLLRRLRRKRDVPRLLFYLHEELHGNLGNMANPALYGRAKTGTKRVVTAYLEEVVATLDELCDLPDEVTAAARPGSCSFFRQATHSFGRSGLVL